MIAAAPGPVAAALTGAHKTLETDEVTAAQSTPDLTVNGSAEVPCGNVQTADATVRLVDTVLIPGS
ncbi:hypothetical protein OG715_02190 [Kitasatospora purpeofusca]|uniref:hypothetical protein n=1 Tax=Kitasatospora purpeofusca TaxID=67352 RepID=UPI002E133F73|nr:hypothetical protein OG715_02190 [Kitasatospora purpeofusca]